MTAKSKFERIRYDLPPDRLAQVPAARRDEAKLLVLWREAKRMDFTRVSELPSFLREGDLLVLNQSRVLPARISCLSESGKETELLVLDPLEPGAEHRGLARGAGRAKAGSRWTAPGGLVLEVLGLDGEGRVLFRGEPREGWASYLEARGRMPLPPYIQRKGENPDLDRLDRERYQCTYALDQGSVAAPTAGLHFTEELLEAVGAKARTAFLSLHVGEATFRSHEGQAPGSEAYQIPAETWKAAQAASRVIAVGTTACRSLETAALGQGLEGRTSLVISPGFSFKITKALMTNFHLPESSPLALAAAFAGKENLLSAYAAALEKGFRFASYGDSMLIL